MIDLRNYTNNKEIAENEKPNKIIDIVEKILDFSKQQKVRGLEKSTPQQILEKLLNETHQIIYSLHRAKQITKKYLKI